MIRGESLKIMETQKRELEMHLGETAFVDPHGHLTTSIFEELAFNFLGKSSTLIYENTVGANKPVPLYRRDEQTRTCMRCVSASV